MLISWVPRISYSYYGTYLDNAGKELPKHYIVIDDFLAALTALYGPLLALIFYSKTLDARRAWMFNLRCILSLITDIDVDYRNSCVSIISIQDSKIATPRLDRSQSGISLRLWGGSSSSKQAKSTFDIQDEEVNPISNVVRISEGL
jgi:hypothetical protein